jgi:hypothetical protein
MNQLRRQNGGMVPPNLQKTVLQNNTPGLYAIFEFPFPCGLEDWGLEKLMVSQYATTAADGAVSKDPADANDAAVATTRAIRNGNGWTPTTVTSLCRQRPLAVETPPP